MQTILTGFLTVLVAISVLAGTKPSPADQLMEQYYLIHKSLSSDSINGVSVAAAQIVKISRQAAAIETSTKAQLTALSDAAAKLPSSDLKSARNGFGELSDKLIAYLAAARTKRNPPYQFYCPMVKKNWLQPDKQTRNPYYGSSMLTCGELVSPQQPASQSSEYQHH
jgi:hypothetical protein